MNQKSLAAVACVCITSATIFTVWFTGSAYALWGMLLLAFVED